MALLIGAEQVENHVPHAGDAKVADALGHLRRRAERTVAPRRLAEVHRVADAERLRRGVECLLVRVVQPREEQMAGAEPGELAARSIRRRADRLPAVRYISSVTT